MAPVLVTLNDLEGHSPVSGLFKCNPSNICAVFYQISTDSASRGPSATAGLLVNFYYHAIFHVIYCRVDNKANLTAVVLNNISENDNACTQRWRKTGVTVRLYNFGVKPQYASPRLWNQLSASLRQPRTNHSQSESSFPTPATSSSTADSPLSSSITPSLFHSMAQNLPVPQIISTLDFLPSSGLTPWFLARHRFF